MVEDKGLPGAVADRIGEFVVLRGRPLELLDKLQEACEWSRWAAAAVAVLPGAAGLEGHRRPVSSISGHQSP